MNRRLEICGEAPAGMLTVIMPAVGIRIHVNGHTIGGSELAVLGLGAELNLTNITPVDGIMLNIPAALFESEHGLKLPTRGQILPIRGRPAAIECFKSSIWSAWQTGAAEAPPPADIVAEIATLMNGSRVPLADARCGEMGRWRVLQRARRYVDAHLTETVDVGDICKHTHVSLSTLERVFRQRLEIHRWISFVPVDSTPRGRHWSAIKPVKGKSRKLPWAAASVIWAGFLRFIARTSDICQVRPEWRCQI